MKIKNLQWCVMPTAKTTDRYVLIIGRKEMKIKKPAMVRNAHRKDRRRIVLINGREEMKIKKPAMVRNAHRRCGRGNRIRTCGLYVPNVALYQTELCLDFVISIIAHYYSFFNPQNYFF